MITRYHGEPRAIAVVFASNPLAPYGYSYDDIEDISANLKLNPATDDDDAYLEKKKSVDDGVVLDEAEHRFVMQIASDDYDNLVVGKIYQLTLNVLCDGENDYIELAMKDRSVQIVADFNRE